MSEHESDLLANGVGEIVSSLTLQLPMANFFWKNFGSCSNEEHAQRHLRTALGVVQAAKKAGAVLVWEQIVSTALSEAGVDHTECLTLHCLFRKHIHRVFLEKEINEVCTGAMLQEYRSANKGSDAGLPPESWRRMTTADWTRLAFHNTLGNEEQAPFRPFNEDPTAEEAEEAPGEDGSGVCGEFMTAKMLPVLTEGEQLTAQANRMRTWRVHPTSGHDPRVWTSYVRETETGYEWHPDPAWARRYMRICDFRDGQAGWLVDADNLLHVGFPFVRPTAAEQRRWMIQHAARASAGMLQHTMRTMSAASVEQYVTSVNPWAHRSPIEMGTASATRPVVPEDAEFYPNTERMRLDIMTIQDQVQQAALDGRLAPEVLEWVYQGSIDKVRALHAQPVPEGFSEVPGSVHREAVQLADEMGADLDLEAAVSQTQKRKAKVLRHMLRDCHTDFPRANRKSAHVAHFCETLWSYVGASASQVAVTMLMTILVGWVFNGNYVKKANYILMGGPPGCGKSWVLGWMRQIIPRCAYLDLGSMSAKMAHYAKTLLDQKIAIEGESQNQGGKDDDKRMVLDKMVSEGALGHIVTVMNKEKTAQDDPGTVAVSNTPTRTMLFSAANKDPGNDGSGRNKSRRLTKEMSGTEVRRPPSPNGPLIEECLFQKARLAAALTGQWEGMAMYRAAGFSPTGGDKTIYRVFQMVVLDQVPALARFGSRGDARQRQAMEDIATAAWRFRLVLENCWDGPGHPIKSPDTVAFARLQRSQPMHSVDCAHALRLCPAGNSESRRTFLSVLLENMVFSSGGLVRSEHPDDEGYFRTKFRMAPNNQFPNHLTALCAKRQIAAIFLADVKDATMTEPIAAGMTAVKVETNSGSTSVPYILVHEQILREGFRYVSEGQKGVIRTMLDAGVAHSWPPTHQRSVAFAPELVAELRKDSGTEHSINASLTLMEQWRMPGKPDDPIFWKADLGGAPAVRSRLSMTVCEIVAGAAAANAEPVPPGSYLDPQRAPGGVFARAKLYADTMAWDAEFWHEHVAAILAGTDVMVASEMACIDTALNEFFLIAGHTPTGASEVWNGVNEDATVDSNISSWLSLKNVAVKRVLPNPLYSPGHSAYDDLLDDGYAEHTSMSVFAGRSHPTVTFTHRSNLDAVIAAECARAEDRRTADHRPASQRTAEAGPSRSQASVEDGAHADAATPSQSQASVEDRERSPSPLFDDECTPDHRSASQRTEEAGPSQSQTSVEEGEHADAANPSQTQVEGSERSPARMGDGEGGRSPKRARLDAV